jgi:hypothetical protein
MKGKQLRDEAKVLLSGESQSGDVSLWNKVVVKGSSYTVERGASILAKINLDEIPISLITEKKVSKDQCALCKGHYDRSSVMYRIPNHRILDLQRNWNYIRDGRRYQSASFKYAETKVCVFCFQLVSHLPENERHTYNNSLATNSLTKFDGSTLMTNSLDSLSLHKSLDNESTLKSTGYNSNQVLDELSIVDNLDENKLKHVNILRSNISSSCIRCYQSSEVDGYIASNAINVQQNKISKTRREVDPWWEIDWGKPKHFHSLSFNVINHLSQKLFVSVCLLKRPTGHEDPFLDSAIKKSVNWKEFTVGDTTGGNDDTAPDQPIELTWELPANSIGTTIRIQLRGVTTLTLSQFKIYLGDTYVVTSEDDYEINKNSFASIAPVTMKEGKIEMMSPSKKKLITTLRARKYQKEVASTISVDDVSRITEMIETKKSMIMRWQQRVISHIDAFTKDEWLAWYRVLFVDAIDTDETNLYRGSKYQLAEEDLFTSGILTTYPRCDLSKLINKLKTILRWLQSKSNLKTLGVLVNNEKLVELSDDFTTQMHYLTLECGKIDKYYNRYYQKINKSKTNTNRLQEDKRGCSWSQFIMILSLVFQERFSDISHVVYDIDDLSDLVSLTSSDNRSGSGMTKSLSVGAPGNLHYLQDLVAKQNTNPYKRNYEFCKYKLQVVSKRTAQHPEFPKKLNPNFEYKKLLEENANAPTGTEEENYFKELMKEKVSKDQALGIIERIMSPNREGPSTSSFFASMTSSAAAKNDDDDKGTLVRVCGLCGYRFPSTSVEIKCMKKHIIDLRKSWNYNLVKDELESFENNVSMFNLTNICLFCAQYFNPDCPDGISYPNQEKKVVSKPPSSHAKAAQKSTPITELVPFYDQRFPSKNENDLDWRRQLLKSREYASFAVESMTIADDEATVNSSNLRVSSMDSFDLN